MCKPFEIAKEIVDDFVARKEPFSLEELRNEILEKGGVFRIYADVTLNDYLESLEEENIIYYGGQSQKYYPSDEIIKKVESYFAELAC